MGSNVLLCLRKGVPREENFGFFFTTNLIRDAAEVCENIKKGGTFRDGGMRGEDDIIGKKNMIKIYRSPANFDRFELFCV